MQQLTDFKQNARTTWGTGDYDAMMRQEGLYAVGSRLVGLVDVSPGDDVLDVACGTGNAAIPAAEAGARVTGLDLTPEMLEVARVRAETASVDVTWLEGDAEDLPFEDGSFDVVVSTFGCMFAPRAEVVADEAARVLRPGGRLGLCAWTPEGAFGDFFAVVAAHMPPLPDFVDPPLAWGDERRVRELFEGTGLEVEFRRAVAQVRHDSVDAAIDCYATKFGPVVRTRLALEAEGRWPKLRADMADLFERFRVPDGPRVELPAEYLVVLARKTG